MTFPEKRKRKMTRQFLYEGTEETQSTPDEHFNREFFLPLVDTALASLNERFTRMEDVYDLYGFLFSKENMLQTIRSGKLESCCKTLEKTLHDNDSEDLVLEIRAAVHAFPDDVSASPREMLNYKELSTKNSFSISVGTSAFHSVFC